MVPRELTVGELDLIREARPRAKVSRTNVQSMSKGSKKASVPENRGWEKLCCRKRLVKTKGSDRTALWAIVREFVFLPEQSGLPPRVLSEGGEREKQVWVFEKVNLKEHFFLGRKSLNKC